jgi:phosphatidylglycerol lysyltransferase
MSVGAILYGSLGMIIIEKAHLCPKFSFFNNTALVLENIFLFYTPDVVAHPSNQLVFLFNTLNIIGLFIIMLTFFFLFKPAKYLLIDRVKEVEKAKTILKKYSNSTEDYIKLWPSDKHYFFNKQETAFLSYKVSKGVALILDNAVGDNSQIDILFKAFTDFCLKNNWMPSVIHADNNIGSWVNKNYKKFYIGSEAIVDLNTFCDKTVHNKHFRYVKNKSEKDGIVFQYWEHPIDEHQLKMLEDVSTRWLNFNKRREYCYAMGYFDKSYLEKCDIGVAIKDKKIIAFTNLIPTYTKDHQSIDMMRYIPESSSMVMHYLLMNLMQHLHNDGNLSCNLGLSPLSNLDQQPNNANIKILRLIKKMSRVYYSFNGLEQFKNKFKPQWSDRYIYYYGLPTALLPVALGLEKALSFKKADYRVRNE